MLREAGRLMGRARLRLDGSQGKVERGWGCGADAQQHNQRTDAMQTGGVARQQLTVLEAGRGWCGWRQEQTPAKEAFKVEWHLLSVHPPIPKASALALGPHVHL